MEHSELIKACKQNDLGRVRELLDHGADPNLQTGAGWTALMYASRLGRTDVVRLLLLDHGTDPNLQTRAGWTAMNWASYGGYIDVVRLLLLDHGADPNLQNDYVQTALMFASKKGHTNVVKLIWDHTIVNPLKALNIFPEGLIREHLMISV
jgi:ankyrin repeat protein